jgi:AcrR family transcriptional regulator
MDAVAARAGTSKRSLYAHFASKEVLVGAVLDLAREMHLDRLGTPGAYAQDPAEAVTLFCGRFMELMLWDPQVRTCRLVIADAERLPGGARGYFDAVFDTTGKRLGAHLCEHWDLDEEAGADLAEDLLGRTVLPRLFRALLGVEDATTEPPDGPRPAVDANLRAIRRLVASALPG